MVKYRVSFDIEFDISSSTVDECKEYVGYKMMGNSNSIRLKELNVTDLNTSGEGEEE